MKHLLLLLLAVAIPLFARASAAGAAPCSGTNTAPLELTAATAQRPAKKVGFFKKTIAKAIARKINRALAAGSADAKTVAILAHVTIIGWIVALFMNKDNPSSLGGYHLAQVLGLILMAVLMGLVNALPFIGLLSLLVLLAVLINWVAGLIHAINGEEKPMPILGKLFNKWFRKLF